MPVSVHSRAINRTHIYGSVDEAMALGAVEFADCKDAELDVFNCDSDEFCGPQSFSLDLETREWVVSL